MVIAEVESIFFSDVFFKGVKLYKQLIFRQFTKGSKKHVNLRLSLRVLNENGEVYFLAIYCRKTRHTLTNVPKCRKSCYNTLYRLPNFNLKIFLFLFFTKLNMNILCRLYSLIDTYCSFSVVLCCQYQDILVQQFLSNYRYIAQLLDIQR